jgi:hypothetical protein
LRVESKNNERWRELCERAVFERDPDRFLATIQELLKELEDPGRRRNAPELGTPPPGEKSTNLGCPFA